MARAQKRTQAAAATAARNATIVSLALLDTNLNRFQRDYLDCFLPFVAEALRALDGDIIAEAELKKLLLDMFGLDLPQSAVKALLRRAKSSELVRLENKVFRPNRSRLVQSRFSDTQARVLESHGRLLENIVSFSRQQFEVEISPGEAEAALQAFIRDNQFSLINGIDGLASVLPTPRKEAHPDRDRFLIASFIRHVQERRTADLDYLDMVIKGAILSAALFLEVPGQAARNFKNTDVYFDTSCIIFALGHAGPIREAPFSELLALLYEAGAGLRCFRHTFEEVRGALIAIAQRMRSGALATGYGPTWEYFIEQQYTLADVERIIASLERDVENLRIEIVDRPLRRMDRPELLIDEEKLSALIAKNVRYMFTDPALGRDVESIAAIVRLRGERWSSYVENSGAVFVTTTRGLVKSAAEFFKSENQGQGAAACMTADALTNLLWLKKPTKAPDLPWKRLVADAYAATQPDAALWKRFAAEVERLKSAGKIGADDYYLLRCSLESRAALMERTLGEEEAFSEGDVNEILRAARERIQAEARAGMQHALQEEMERVRLATDMRVEAEAQAESWRLRERERVARVEHQAQRLARWIAQVGSLSAVLLLSAGSIATLIWALVTNNSPLPYVLLASQLGSVLFGVWNWHTGTSVRAAVRSMELRLAGWFRQILLKVGGGPLEGGPVPATPPSPTAV